MSQERPPPPPAPTCLVTRYSSSQKGGTLVAEDVLTFELHRQRLCHPGGYRPEQCLACLGRRLHVHDYRERRLHSGVDGAAARVVRYVCCSCGAIWLVLPLFIARLLRRTWHVIEAHALGAAPPGGPPVPARTVRRWRARLAASARHAVQVLATSGQEAFERLAGLLGRDCTRGVLALGSSSAFGCPGGQRLASVAALLHRLAPGVRLM